VTVCQVHAAVDAIVQSWWLDRQSADTLINRVADRLQYHQQRNALARRSHTKTTKRDLRRIGIDVSTLKRCDSDTS
jgi:hypothetical protein